MEPEDFTTEPAPAPVVADAPASEPAAESDLTLPDGAHSIEHRSFARDSADQPMPVTVITGA